MAQSFSTILKCSRLLSTPGGKKVEQFTNTAEVFLDQLRIYQQAGISFLLTRWLQPEQTSVSRGRKEKTTATHPTKNLLKGYGDQKLAPNTQNTFISGEIHDTRQCNFVFISIT